MARPRKFDETGVVAAARDQFWDAGYAATSLTDLTDATGLGRASLYGAFGDKHTLYLRVFDEYIAGAVQSVADDLAGDDAGALDRIRAHLLENARASAGNARGCLLARGTAELAGRDEDVATRSQRAFAALAARTRRPSRRRSERATSIPTPTPTRSGTCCSRSTAAPKRSVAAAPTRPSFERWWRPPWPDSRGGPSDEAGSASWRPGS